MGRVARKSSFEMTELKCVQLPTVVTPKRRKKNMLQQSRVDSEELDVQHISHSSEPEELEICDDNDEDDEFVPHADASGPKIDESPRSTVRRSHSFSDLSRALAENRPMSFDEHRDQFERLWQASQTLKVSFEEIQSITYDSDLSSRVQSGTLQDLINKLADQEKQGSLPLPLWFIVFNICMLCRKTIYQNVPMYPLVFYLS